MKLSIVMPVYNEIENIEQIIEKVLSSNFDKEIIIIDDGSTDGTGDFLLRYAKNHNNIKVYYHDMNRGKTAAIRTALEHISGDIVVIQDGDLEYNPADYKQLVEPIISDRADVVYGSRFFNINKYLFVWHWFSSKLFKKPYEIKYLSNFFGIQLLNFIAFLLYGAKISDIATGYKVFRRNIIKEIKLDSDRFEFCYEITAKIAKKNIKIKEVPIDYHPRSNLRGKKITWRDGVSALKTLIKYKIAD